jgi:hypothetical protein
MTQPSSEHSSAPAALAPSVINVLLKLLPITAAVFVSFLIIGMQLPVLPLHLHNTLGMNTLVVGLVIGV